MKRKIVTKRGLVIASFLTPYLIVFFVFTVLPVLASMVLSLTSFNMIQPPKFVAFANYERLFLGDDIFPIALKNTFVIALITGPISYVACFAFAWLINELPSKPRAFMTLLFYAPTLAGNMYVIWSILFSGDSYGLINGTLMKMGIILQPIQWLTDVKYMMITVIIVVLWQSLGAGFLSFIAGLQTIDTSLFEAGAIDGIRNRWQELWYITLPSMKPQLMFGAVMSITSSFGVGPVISALIPPPSTDYAVHTLVHHLEDYGSTRFEMGYASAIATLLFIIMLASNKLVQAALSRIGK